VITWSDPAQIVLVSGFPIEATGDRLDVRQALGFTLLKSSTLGDHSASLTLPSWAKPPPAFVAPPAYDEPVN
jgi:hypothetical protein